MTPPERPEVAALAVASTREINTHSQMCPVWTQRMADARKPWQDVIVKCDCWVIPEAERSIRVMRERGIAVWATAAEPLRGALEQAVDQYRREWLAFANGETDDIERQVTARDRMFAALEATAPSTPARYVDPSKLGNDFYRRNPRGEAMTPAETMLVDARADLKDRQEAPRHWNPSERDGLVEAEMDLAEERVRTLEKVVAAEAHG